MFNPATMAVNFSFKAVMKIPSEPKMARIPAASPAARMPY